MSPALLNIFYITNVILISCVCDGQRLVTNPHADTHTHMHARHLTHTRNQLRYCRIIHLCVYVCAHIILYCSVCPCGAFGQLFIYTN